MTIVKQNLPRKTKAKIILCLVAIVAILLALILDIVCSGPLTSLLSNRDQIVATIKEFGIFGPLAFVVLQTLQTVLAPIPGQVTGSIGGFLFGWWGVLWTLIGNILGCFIVFWLSKRFGRPLVEKIFKKEAVEKFDFLISGKRASVALFLIFLLPGLPDDMVCYLGGLTDLPIRQLMVLVTVGHIPTIVVNNYIGLGLGESQLLPVVLIAITAVALLLIVYHFREKILGFLKDQML